MDIKCFPKDIQKLFESYLNEDEQIYYSNNWNNFDNYKVCEIAAKNGWLDLLKWFYMFAIKLKKFQLNKKEEKIR